MKVADRQDGDELRPEYQRSDFGEMVRGKYAHRIAQSRPDAQVAVTQPPGVIGETMHLTFECEPEADGRWLANVPQLPGVMAYGLTAAAAMANVQVLALRVVAEQIERDHGPARNLSMALPPAA
jgi:predicted RNase H-like HicB family nuclease